MDENTGLFKALMLSTLWNEPASTRILWISMLALKNKKHIVYASTHALADIAKISIIECSEGLKTLSSPDPYSQSKEESGRRIKEIDNGWLIIQGAEWHHIMMADKVREDNRIKQLEYRAKKRKTTCPENFQPSLSALEFAKKNSPEKDLIYETQRFINYHLARETLFMNWDRAWSNWISDRFTDRKISPKKQTGSWVKEGL